MGWCCQCNVPAHAAESIFIACHPKPEFKRVLCAAVELSRALLHLRVPEWAVEEATSADGNPEHQRNRWG